MDQLRQLKNLKDKNHLLNEFLQLKTNELNEVLAAKHRLDEMPQASKTQLTFPDFNWRRCNVKVIRPRS